MKVSWDEVRSRYGEGAKLAAVVGGSQFEIVGVDELQIHFTARLWTDVLARERLEQAAEYLEAGPSQLTATDFLERYRMVIERDATVEPGCSRIPNMATLVLADLGFFDKIRDEPSLDRQP